MMSYLKLCALLPLVLGSALCCKAQQTIAVSGGNGSTGIGTISYTVGQIDYINSYTSEISVNEGVQQPFEIFDVTGIPEKPFKFNFSLYPNPTENLVTLALDSIIVDKMTYRIMDLAGKVMEQNSIFSSTTQIQVDGFAEGTYMICILKSEELLHTFLLVKH